MIPYGPACELQHELVEARKANAIPDVLLLCEHPHVITLGRNGKREHLRAGSRLLDQMRVEFHPTDRGGDITYHGPGQIVGYPILDLTAHRRDVRWYVEQLEEAMIRATATLASQGTAAKARTEFGSIRPQAKKSWPRLACISAAGSLPTVSPTTSQPTCAISILIVPCGIPDKRATSLEKILGSAASRERSAGSC